MADRTPSDHLRFEVAFTTDPDSATPAFVDLTSRVHLPSGITVRRGRGDEFETVQTGTAQLTLENIDGELTPDRSSSSFYPYVLPMRRCRLTYRDPATLGTRNMLPAEDASFESGTVGSWAGIGGAAVANDTAHADAGTKALRVTWPTGGLPWAQLAVTGLTIGRTYTARARVWSATGVPDIRLGVLGIVNGTPTSTKNAFSSITVTFTATARFHHLIVTPAAAATAGQQTWVDAVMFDEGSSLSTFTTTAPDDATSPVILGRFDGYIDEWPVEWPDGGELYSRGQLTAVDTLARIGARQRLRSVVVETFGVDGPAVHYPLDEPEGSTSVFDVVERPSAVALAVRQVGAGGGTLTFASGTGVPTDGAAAPQFAPASSTSGFIITGRTAWLNYTATPTNADTTLVVALNTSTAAVAVAVGLFDNFGNGLTIEVNATGRLVARYVIPYFGVDIATTSTNIYSDGQTHHVAATVSLSAGTITVRLVVDGVATSSSSLAGSPGGMAPFQNLHIGGLPTGSLFTGTLSHVAVFASNMDPSRLLEQRLAQTTGFAGERSDQRIARICSWVGLPTTRQKLDVGVSTSISHFDPAGLNPLEAMRKVEATEGGLLFADTDGTLTFYARSRMYAVATPAVDVPAHMLAESSRLAKNTQLVRNVVNGSRADGVKYRALDAASRTAYGEITDTLELVTTSDAEVIDAVTWRLNTSSQPLARFSSLQLDAYTDATYSPGILANTAIGSRVRITGAPAQAPTSTLLQLIQGYTETITPTSWDIDVNATPVAQATAAIADDATYGIEGGPYVAAY